MKNYIVIQLHLISDENGKRIQKDFPVGYNVMGNDAGV